MGGGRLTNGRMGHGGRASSRSPRRTRRVAVFSSSPKSGEIREKDHRTSATVSCSGNRSDHKRHSQGHPPWRTTLRSISTDG